MSAAEGTSHRTDAPVVVVGAGPVGLTLALDLARRDVEVVLVERRARLSGAGSRAITLAAHAIRALQQVGVGDELLGDALVLRSARTYYRRRELFAREFPPPGPGLLPAFVNVPQSRTEHLLLRRAEASPRIALRWGTEVVGVEQDDDEVTATVNGPGGLSTLRAAYLVGCDGSRSAVRELAGIGFPGRAYDDQFLIADIRARLPFPAERRFFFHAPSNAGRQVLVHPQPDDVWRIDWQVPAGVDVGRERASGALDARIAALVGDAGHEIVWSSAYRFHQRVATRLRAGRVLVAGDAAHVMSPFGARGLNSGLEDAANLGWRLPPVLRGEAPSASLDAYAAERRLAARENVRVTDATMRFMAPAGRWRRMRRDLTLATSVRLPRLHARVDSGRLAEPARYATVADAWPVEGEYAPDVGCRVALTGEAVGVQRLRGTRHALLVVPPAGAAAGGFDPPDEVLVLLVDGAPAEDPTAGVVALEDPDGALRERYGADGLAVGYLLRPDGYVAARVACPDVATLGARLLEALGRVEPTPARAPA